MSLLVLGGGRQVSSISLNIIAFSTVDDDNDDNDDEDDKRSLGCLPISNSSAKTPKL